MNLNNLLGLLIFGALALCRGAIADEGSDALAKHLRMLYPGTKVDSVRESAMNGIYEVRMGRNVAYTNAAGRYLLFGHLYDMTEQRDLTIGVTPDSPRVDAAALPTSDAIITKRGNGVRTLSIFTDPLCPHCSELDRILADVASVEVRRYVVSLIEPQTAADRAIVLKECGTGEAACASLLARNRKLFDRLGLAGTPTLIDRRGRVLAGAQAALAIDAWLDEPEQAQSESKQ